MRDDERGAPFSGCRNGFLDEAFALAVEGRGCLIEQQDRRFAYQCAGEGHTLALTAGETAPLLANIGVETAAIIKKAPGFCHLGRTDHGGIVRLSIPRAKRDIVPRRAREESRFLRRIGKLAAPEGGIGFARFQTVDADTPGLRVEQAKRKAEDRRLAGA